MKCTRFPLIFLIITLSGCASSPYTSQDTHLVNESLKEIQNGNYEQAEADLLVGLHLNPNNPILLRSLGKLYEKTGRVEDARAMYEKAFVVESNIAAQEIENTVPQGVFS